MDRGVWWVTVHGAHRVRQTEHTHKIIDNAVFISAVQKHGSAKCAHIPTPS